MKSYEEISNRIMQRGDEILEARKVRTTRIKHISYAVSGLCAAAIAGFGVWHTSSSIQKPADPFNGTNIAVTQETSADPSETTAAETESSTAYNVVTSVSTAAVTTEDITSVTETADTSAGTQPQVTESTAPSETVSPAPTEEDIRQTFEGSKAVFTKINSDTPVISPCSLTMPVNGGIPGKPAEYEKDNVIVPSEEIVGLIGTASVQIGEGDLAVNMDMEVYEIADTEKKRQSPLS